MSPRTDLVLRRTKGRPEHLFEHVGLPLDREADLTQMAGFEAKLEKLSRLDARREGPTREQLS